MVRIRILRGKAIARWRSLRQTGFSDLIVVAAILAVTLAGRGPAGDDGTAEAASVIPFAESRDAPAAEPETSSADGSSAAASRDRGAREAELAPSAVERAAVEPGAREPWAVEPRQRTGDHPANLLQLPASVESALVFDLEANRMHVFERSGQRAGEVGDYFVAVGKNGIDKAREGDEKTPVGIYFVTSYSPGERLPPIYGVGAFPISYPNSWDRRLRRTGSGIWIHGTDKDENSLEPQSSRGCLTLHNGDFRTMSDYIDIRRTPVIVTDAVSWTTAAAIEAHRASLAAAVETWRRDWESLDTDAYLAHYSPSFRTDDAMDLARWTAHKRRVNAQKSYIRVDVDDVGIYAYPGEAGLFLVTFEQRYGSSNFQSRRWKHQYWRIEDGAWRIVHEGSA